MKYFHLAAGLAFVAGALAEQAPTLEVVARQACEWTGHCRGEAAITIILPVHLRVLVPLFPLSFCW